MQLHEIDLNLLVVFRTLLAERRVSRTAEALGLTQPAVSNALARLRRLLGDELFLRTPQGMEPTPYAQQLAEPVAYALGALHEALNQQAGFDAARAQRCFTLGMTDIGELYFLPGLVEAAAARAPGVTLATVRNGALDLRAAMEAGKVDLAIGLLPQLKSGFFQRRLFTTRYVVLMRRGHALAGDALSLAEFGAAEHLVVTAHGTGHGQVDTLLQRAGIARRVRLTVPDFTPVGQLLQAGELLATVPQPLAERLAEPFGLHWVPHPAALPAVSINLFWHARAHRDPANAWLRTLIVQRFATD